MPTVDVRNQLLLVRDSEGAVGANGIHGTLFLRDGAAVCQTMELPWLNNARRTSCIKPGHYQLVQHWRAIAGLETLRLLAVEGRDGILIHVANLPKDILGCIAVGMTRTGEHTRSVGLARSREAMRRVLELRPISIEVRWGVGDDAA